MSQPDRRNNAGTPAAFADLINSREAARLFPGATRPSGNSVWRWMRKGVVTRKGTTIRLRHVRIGGKLMTTRGWVEQFLEGVTADNLDYFRTNRHSHRRRRTSHGSAQHRLDDIRQRLDAHGI